MKPTVFIHTSSHEIVSGKVAMYSHMRASKHLDKFDIQLIQLEDYPHLIKRHGQSCIRFGKEAAWYKDVPQSFLPLRFLVPQLMGYEGRAILTDPDIFAVRDAYELLTRDMGNKAILCREFGDKYKGYNSSVMLLDCSKLKHWKWEERIDEIFASKLDIQDWISLRTEPEEIIGTFEQEWNDYDSLTQKTKFLHNTRQITQPWKTGLPFKEKNMSNYNKGDKEETRWEKLYDVVKYNKYGKRQLFKSIKNIILYGEAKLYQKHPDVKQEKLFLSLLKESVNKGLVTSELLQSEVKQGHIRPDIFNILQSVSYSPSDVLQTVS
ncbi:hypothetical protein DSM106972_076800 [Dulcicalothrix desertica PCC 7102]|uniref:Glycosyl transferase n=1 Tax=Dulcicalothrix desertica PCC 7102 TaxID=232991 RepID=A0A3S1CF18_9CYAN|nr:hypothetical protein [Dulcicalothrix desertica]RUT00232.1 hypothetical protein DSM106972_076800 [Dulcicalothrix desertica PCC 7102]TWH55699.1 hypothetical protein CAL7102_03863 [Dulcicalothrix desertica PCC 7102]